MTVKPDKSDFTKLLIPRNWSLSPSLDRPAETVSLRVLKPCASANISNKVNVVAIITSISVKPVRRDATGVVADAASVGSDAGSNQQAVFGSSDAGSIRHDVSFFSK